MTDLQIVVQKILKENLGILSTLKDYQYTLWDYKVSHGSLTLRAINSQINSDLMVYFSMVRYIQMPFFWQGDFEIAPLEELLVIHQLIDWGKNEQELNDLLLDNPSRLFKANSLQGIIYVFGLFGGVKPYDSWQESQPKFA